MGNFRLRDIGILSQTQGEAFPSGATHYWRFEDNYADAIGAVTLANTAGMSFDTVKNLRGSKYNGTSYMTYNTNCNFGTAGSFSYWIKLINNNNQQCFKGNSMDMQIYGTKFYWKMLNMDSSWSISANAVGTGWKHIVMIWNGASRKLYKNNVIEINTTGGSGTPVNGTLQIGTTGGFYCYTNGTILDEMSWWNRALTATEVANLYNSGSGLFY